ncbi:MAG: hypothetical protein WB679_22970 [Terracidiphilus sp.]
MSKFLSHPLFLRIYSGALTAVFTATTALNLWNVPHSVSGAEQHHVDFDQLSIHRINIVEPDGTPRLVISDKAEFPGGFYMGKEFSRADRADAGMLFMNDEGTENGGMLLGGYKDGKGEIHSMGHLSFDAYEQDQTMSLDSSQDGSQHYTAYQINDSVGDTLFTPQVLDSYATVRAMPDGPEKQKARAALKARYPYRLPERAALVRDVDNSVMLRMRDPDGHTRIMLRVAPDGTPTMQFLDASGKVTQQWPEKQAPSQPGK